MIAAVPGLLMKSGAEGVCAFALADGLAGAVKFDDGAQRAVPPVMAELLARLLTAEPDPEAMPAGTVPDLAALNRLARTPVTGGGVPVGEIRAVLAGGSTAPGSEAGAVSNMGTIGIPLWWYLEQIYSQTVVYD